MENCEKETYTTSVIKHQREAIDDSVAERRAYPPSASPREHLRRQASEREGVRIALATHREEANDDEESERKKNNPGHRKLFSNFWNIRFLASLCIHRAEGGIEKDIEPTEMVDDRHSICQANGSWEAGAGTEIEQVNFAEHFYEWIALKCNVKASFECVRVLILVSSFRCHFRISITELCRGVAHFLFPLFDKSENVIFGKLTFFPLTANRFHFHSPPPPPTRNRSRN